MKSLVMGALMVLVAAAGCGGSAKPAPAVANAASTTTAPVAAGEAKCVAPEVALDDGGCGVHCKTDEDCPETSPECVEAAPGEMRREQAADGSFTGPVLEPERVCGGD